MTEPGWRQSDEDDPNDIIFCYPGGDMIGRVYLDIRVRQEDGTYHWRWFYSNQTGTKPSRREAMLAVEEAWEGRGEEV
jgi:hypothetical protein